MTLTNKELIVYFSKIFKIRETENKIVKEYSNEQMRCPVHLSIGQEAPSAAVNLLKKKILPLAITEPMRIILQRMEV